MDPSKQISPSSLETKEIGRGGVTLRVLRKYPGNDVPESLASRVRRGLGAPPVQFTPGRAVCFETLSDEGSTSQSTWFRRWGSSGRDRKRFHVDRFCQFLSGERRSWFVLLGGPAQAALASPRSGRLPSLHTLGTSQSWCHLSSSSLPVPAVPLDRGEHAGERQASSHPCSWCQRWACCLAHLRYRPDAA